MEVSKLVIDDEYSSENKMKTTLVTDRVEPEVIPPQSLTTHEFIPREIEFLHRHRQKTRLLNPKGVYEFRHIQQTWFQSVLQAVTMLISLVCMLGLYYWGYQESKEVMIGVGEVSSLTWINVIEAIMTVGIIIFAIKKLGKHAKQHQQRRYQLAMLSNAFNRMLLNNIRLIIIMFVPLMIAFIVDPSLQSVNDEMLDEGAFADLVAAIYSLICISICFRAFRFCGKELTA